MSSDSVRQSVELSKLAASFGYHAAIARSPRMPHADPQLYLRALADASPLPLVAEGALESLDHPNIVSSPPPRIANLAEPLRGGADFVIYPFAAAAPFACVTILEAVMKREYEAAEDWQNRILPAVELVTHRYGIPGLKYAMDFNGYYGGPTRLPLVPLLRPAQEEIEAAFHGLRG